MTPYNKTISSGDSIVHKKTPYNKAISSGDSIVHKMTPYNKAISSADSIVHKNLHIIRQYLVEIQLFTK